jgi:hypothetical protein
MLRYSVVLLAALGATEYSAAGPETDGLFPETSKDFGSVPRGPVLAHPFHLVNNTGEAIRITRLRVSCGCTVAHMEHAEIPPGRSAALVAEMHTDRFVGDKTVTIFVGVDRPSQGQEEVLLQVHARSCEEVLISPTTLDFGRSAHSGGLKARVVVSFPGAGDSQILRATSDSAFVHAQVRESATETGERVYQITADLRDGLPPGRWFTELWLQTNHPWVQRIRVPVAVEIEPALGVSPASLRVEAPGPGQRAQRKVLVHGCKPFTILAIQGGDARWLAHDDTPGLSPRHVLTITLDNAVAGTPERVFKVITDLPEASTVEFRVRAEPTR